MELLNPGAPGRNIGFGLARILVTPLGPRAAHVFLGGGKIVIVVGRRGFGCGLRYRLRFNGFTGKGGRRIKGRGKSGDCRKHQCSEKCEAHGTSFGGPVPPVLL